jgi:hypothetical protein
MSTHFFSTSAGLAMYVFICLAIVLGARTNQADCRGRGRQFSAWFWSKRAARSRSTGSCAAEAASKLAVGARQSFWRRALENYSPRFNRLERRYQDTH